MPVGLITEEIHSFTSETRETLRVTVTVKLISHTYTVHTMNNFPKDDQLLSPDLFSYGNDNIRIRLDPERSCWLCS